MLVGIRWICGISFMAPADNNVRGALFLPPQNKLLFEIVKSQKEGSLLNRNSTERLSVDATKL